MSVKFDDVLDVIIERISVKPIIFLVAHILTKFLSP